ncbi:MAG: 3-deoxy-manno-octulosonate cytidylyltransferase [Elusimicrobiaceae bacterium]|nr:3-deoxy-manno-octulosonate cytidylyltransferase [Elusimicrobiaceae bacterium]
MSEVVIAIPARYGSTRFPGKVAALLAGKPVIQHVYEACKKTNLGPVVIATEDQRVVDICAKFGAQAVLTSAACQSGTDRIFEATRELKANYIINVQGDEPFIHPKTVISIARLLQKDPTCDIATAVTATTDDAKIDNPNCVKAVLGKDKRALYFSRSRVPFNREPSAENKDFVYWHHCGIYGYRKSALKKFVSLAQSPLEKMEKLEQLRALENGLTIKCVQIEPAGPAIDTPDDLTRAEAYYKEHFN